MRRIVPLLITALLGFSTVSAQVSFSVVPDRTRTTKNEPVMVTATIQASRNLGTVPIPAVPASDAFAVIQTTRNQSSTSSIQIVNGSASQHEEVTYYFYYTVAPRKLGSFTFPSLSIAVDGKTYSSQPFNVDVATETVTNPDILVSLAVSKTNPYVGEQCLLTVRVAQKPRAPVQLSNEGFNAFVQAIEKELSKRFSYTMLSAGRLIQTQEMVNGEQYAVYKIPYALFPTSQGSCTISSIPFQYNELKRSNRRGVDPFDAFFGGGFFDGGVEANPRTAASNPVTIIVRPLPPSPPDFSGAVGKFTLAANVDPRQVAAGDAVTLKVAIAGNNRPGSIGDIKLPAMTNVEAFTPEKSTAIDTAASGITGRKTFKYLLIPHQEGSVAIPPVGFVYFDPSTDSYQHLRSDTFALEVSRGKEGAKPQTRYLTQQDIREVGRDIRYIKTPRHLTSQIEKPYRNPLLYVAYPLPFLLVLFSILYKVQSEQRQSNPGLSLQRRAMAAALRRLSGIQQKQGSLGTTDFLGQAGDALTDYLTHKFGFAAQGKTIADLAVSLAQADVAAPIVDKLTAFLERLDSYRFSGNVLDVAVKTEVLSTERELIAAIETSGRRRKKL